MLAPTQLFIAGYRAMNFSAKRGLAICRSVSVRQSVSVCPSVYVRWWILDCDHIQGGPN